jgi:hypothetical protein
MTTWMEGWAMPVEQAVREALGATSGTLQSNVTFQVLR